MRNAENVKMEKAEAGFEVVNGRRGMAAGNDEEMEIDLLDLGNMLLDKIKYIILCLLIGAVLMNLYSYFRIAPTYTSVAKMYIVSASDDSVVDLTDLNIGKALTSDYEDPVSYTHLLREIIYDIGGGIKDGGKFKAVQIGGPSGGCLTEEHLDVGLDFDSVKKYGAIVGSGGLVVMDEHTCMVEVARFFMSFTQRESCGKCVPCREGTKRMLEILERIVAGQGKLSDLDELQEIAEMVKNMALCGLGKSAPLPVLSTLKTFRDEYVEHIVDKKCRAKTCQALRQYKINPEFCKGCSKCARNCPVGAITGQIKKCYHIDPNICIKCGACKDNCAFDAIYVEA